MLVFLEALRMLGDEVSLLRSDIYLGLGVAQAQCGEEQQVLEIVDLAQVHFPKLPEQDPRFLYADCGWFELHSDIGKMYLELARHYPDRKYYEKADGVFTQLVEGQSTSERNTDETIIRQAEAACGLGDLDRYISYLEQGTRIALSLGSQKRYNEAYAVFQRTPDKWKKEQKIQVLAKEIFCSHQKEGRNEQ